MILLLIAACGPSEKGSVADSEAPYLLDESELDLPEPTFDADEASAAVEEALGALVAITAEPIVDAYQDAVEGADRSCPTWYTSDDGQDYWYDDCTSSDGTSFQGYGALVAYATTSDGVALTGSVVYGSGTITRPDGVTLSLNGAAGLLDGEGDNGVQTAMNVVDGDFSLDDADEGWLATGLEPSLTMQALSYGDLRAFSAAGTLAGLDTDIDAILADDMLIATEGTGTPCSLEPTGTLSLRGADGHWTDIIFDVPFDASTQTFGEMDADLCDGCGTAWFEGQEIGQACFDFSVLLDWDGSPWS